MKEFLNKILDLKIKTIEFLDKELSVNKYSEKFKTIDVGVVLDNSKYIHIELNINGSIDYLNMRNFTYFSGFISTNTKKGNSYNYDQEFIHIDLSKRKTYKELKRTYYIMDNNKNKYIENVKIIEYNLDRIRNVFYNLNIERQEKYKVLYMLVSTKEELDKLCIGDEFIMDYKEKVDKINNDEEFISFITREEDEQFILNTEKKISYNAGIKEGKNVGIKETQHEIAKSLKDLDIPIDKIVKATGLSKEEILLL